MKTNFEECGALLKVRNLFMKHCLCAPHIPDFFQVTFYGISLETVRAPKFRGILFLTA